MDQENTVPSLEVGARYSSFDELEAAVHIYEDKKYAVYTINNSYPVEKHNEKAKVPLHQKLKYKTMVLTCKHYGLKRINTKLKGTRPNQKTFKKKCTSRIRLTAFPQFIEVRKMEEAHNHDLDPDLYSMYPEKRRLTEDEREKVGEMLDTLAKPMLIQTKLKKFTTNYDIANVRTKNKTDLRKQYGSETEHLFAVMNEIVNEGGSVIIGQEADENGNADEDEDSCDAKRKVNFIFFQTAQMKRNFEQYPEVIGMDTTYCVNANNMPLVVIRVTDRYGKGQSAGYALVVNEKLDVMKEVVMALMEASKDIVHKVQTVVVDKDYNEVTSIRECMPWVSVHLCLVHVLEAFKRNTKDEPNQAEVREILQKMVYAVTRSKYEELYEDLQDLASDDFLTTFENNWSGYAAAWSSYERLNSFNLSLKTNNAVESHNQKIKTIVNRKSTLPELVKGLLVLHANSTSNANYSDFLGLMKTTYRNDNNDPTLALILNSATPFAGQSMSSEYEMGLKRVDLPDDVNYKNWKPSEDAKTCVCPHFKEKHLPCRHIFSLRQQKGLPLFSKEDVPERWRPVTGDTVKERRDDVATSHIPQGILCTNVLKTGGKALTQRERFKQASSLCDEVASLISLCGGKQYNVKMKIIDTILQIWRRGKEVMVIEADADGHVIIDVPSDSDNLTAATNSETVPDTELERSNEEAKAHNGALVTKSGSSKYKKVSEEKLQNFQIPKAIKVRGRPKGQVLTKIGLRKKITEKAPCETCSTPGFWKTASIVRNDVTVDMLMCPSCQDTFKDSIKGLGSTGSESEREEDADEVEDPDKTIESFLSEDEGDGGPSPKENAEPDKTIEPFHSEDEGDGGPSPKENAEADSIEPDFVIEDEETTARNNDKDSLEPEDNVEVNLSEGNVSDGNGSLSKACTVLQQSSPVLNSYIPTCNCGKVCKRVTTTKGKNTGRDFFTCPDWDCKKKKFRFADTLYNVTAPKMTQEMCFCNLPVKKRSVLFGEKMGLEVSTCPKVKILEKCTYKQYSTAADQGLKVANNGKTKVAKQVEIRVPSPASKENVTVRRGQSEPECPVCATEGKPKKGGAHSCAYCGIPVHAFGCSITIEGGEEGYGRNDKLCISCSKSGNGNLKKRQRPQRDVQLPKKIRNSYTFDTP